MMDMPYIDPRGRVYRYGEFFPPNFTPSAYNHSINNDFYPLTKEAAEEKGYIWHESTTKEFAITIKAFDLPDTINEVDENITKEIISCRACSKAYRIIPLEFQFYRRFSIPLPRLCQDCRFDERFKLVNPPELWHRQCMCDKETHSHVGRCPNQFESSYAPERSDIVYCEDCYQQEAM